MNIVLLLWMTVTVESNRASEAVVGAATLSRRVVVGVALLSATERR